MTTLCYQAPPSSTSSSPLTGYVVVLPDDQGGFQGIESQPVGRWFLYGSHVTTKDSIYKDPYIFLSKQDADDVCQYVNGIIDSYKNTYIKEGWPTSHLVVIPVTISLPCRGANLKDWVENYIYS